MTNEETLAAFGAHYFGQSKARYEAPADHLYHFETYIGPHDSITVRRGCSAWLLSDDLCSARVIPGPTVVDSRHVCTVITGYQPPACEVSLLGGTVLPYVNGCSTKQIVPVQRPGDPTLQYLRIPMFSAEQAHHIHSTVRVVYVLSGRGFSEVGMEGRSVRTELTPGMVCILDPMCPHHFETPQGEALIVVPLHVWSTVPGIEANHPMFNGTFMMNQGGK